MKTITSANAVLMLTCPDVFPIPQDIQGFATEDAWNVAAYELARAVMGVDAKMSAGFIPATKEMDIVLQADSNSRQVLEQIVNVVKQGREIVYLNLQLVIPSTTEVWNMTKGVITKSPGPPAGKKTLEPTTWQITFEDIQPAITL